jgi:hypothetical protein
MKFEAESTYAGSFPEHKIVPRPVPPPVQAVGNPARFDATTTNRETYKQHPIPPKQVLTSTSKCAVRTARLLLLPKTKAPQNAASSNVLNLPAATITTATVGPN